jgi:type I restriction enzyme S subunit
MSGEPLGADFFLKHYERIADAPYAVPRLRRFILDLAVRGKLVPQDPNDEPASELLKRIAKEKARLVKVGEIRKPPTLEPIADAEALYVLPWAWAWVRVGEIFDYDAGTKRDPNELDQSRWLLELEDIEKDTSRIVERLRVSDRDSQSTKSEFQPGDILYGKLRPYLNKVVVADEPGYSTTEIVAIRPFMQLCPEYCALAFRRPDFVAYVERLGRGTKMPRLRTPDAIIALFPLPPLAEQHRIVAKVDELMALCDRLEAERAAREAKRDRLTAASYARLGSVREDRFRDDAQFVLDALPSLTARPDQIKHLRQTILNLAVRGKLVPQDPNDEPASELLKRIAKEKAKSARRNKFLPEIDDAEKTFDAPASWLWVRMGNVFSIRTGFAFKSSTYVDKGTLVFRVTNFDRDGSFDLSDVVFFPTEQIDSKMSGFLMEPGEIIMVMVGGTIGKTTIVDESILPALLNQNMWRIRSFGGVMSSKFEYLLVKNVNQSIQGLTQSTHGHFAMGDYEKRVFPLPPLAEQHRIVAKVDELMALCDGLEAAMQTGTQMQGRLLEAILAAALDQNGASRREIAA